MSYNYKDVHTVMFKASTISFYEHPTYSSVIYILIDVKEIYW